MAHKRTKNVLLLGDPKLRQQSKQVQISDLLDESFQQQLALLKNTLYSFREENGFGRAISGPQIGLMYRVIALHLHENFLFVFNPTITWTSQETFTLWDDCFSLPDLLCKVTRNKSITIRYQDETFEGFKIMENLPQDLSELLQHEVDHLDGILMIDRVQNVRTDIIYRDLYLQEPEPYNSLVDYYYNDMITMINGYS